MLDSKPMRLATIVTVWVVLLAGFAWDRYEGSRDDAAVRSDRAAIEAAALTLRYDDVAAAWTSTKLGDTTALSRLRASIPVPWMFLLADQGLQRSGPPERRRGGTTTTSSASRVRTRTEAWRGSS